MPENTPQRRLTPQETFNIGRRHLLTQRKKSVGSLPGLPENDYCLYRSPQPDGTVLKCGAGPFIADDKHTEAIENRSISDLLFNNPELFSAIPDNIVVRRLQSIHDRFRVEQWNRRLNDLAESNGLSLEPLGPHPHTSHDTLSPSVVPL